MKLFLFIVCLVAAAKFIAHTPQGANDQVDQVSGITVRDIARQVDGVVAKLEGALKQLLS